MGGPEARAGYVVPMVAYPVGLKAAVLVDDLGLGLGEVERGLGSVDAVVAGLFLDFEGHRLIPPKEIQAAPCPRLRASVTSTDASTGTWNRIDPQSFRRGVLNARRIEDCHKCLPHNG